MDKKEELMQMRDTLSSVQKTLSEKETVLQEINACLAEQILKTSSESEMLGACIHHLRNSITNHIHLMVRILSNQGYAFPIQYTEELKDRTTLYETLPYGYR
ncbi:hypothetical protein RirG_249150 [Rhizophagus irregularis DAOM 197198w]|uniref:Uncharacterized protein n=1 Tax=Rhizophagus irregularis (strain DAOM 197198w) TaxID=1432141 RepID=A0A015JD45_RHIIW|nr:hypothetical protein RirG_249150 [Rhizophagus irregularis DAOM 197198w]